MMTLALKYTVFAAVATVANLGSQAISLEIYAGRYRLYCAILCGTAVGLAVKYLLDKRWIFGYQAQGLGDDARKFSLYTAMGIVTTLIFWVSEWSFDRLWAAEEAKYIGAILGLSIGYYTKYQLDKRFVFRTQP